LNSNVRAGSSPARGTNKKKVYSRTPSLDKNPSFLLESL